MEFWDNKAEPSILLAVKSACEAIRGDLVNELQARDQNRHTFLNEEVNRLKDVAAKVHRLELENIRLQDVAAKVNHLEIENLSLQQYLEALRTAKADHICPSIEGTGGPENNNGHSREPGHDGPQNTDIANPNTETGPDYATLAKEYASLLKRFESKQQASRKLKEKTKQWITYAESKDSRIRKLEKKLHALGASREPEHNAMGEDTPLPENDLVNIASSETINRADSEVVFTEKRSNNNAGQGSQLWVSKFFTRSAAPTGPVPSPLAPQFDTSDVERESIETPEYEHEIPMLPELPMPPLPPLRITGPGLQDVSIKPEPSSDAPVFVSERVVRKRRHDGEDQMPPPRTRLKKETTNLSSDPVLTEQHVNFLPHESLDLDEGNDGLPTPKKQRFLGVETFQGVTVTREAGHPKDDRRAATSNMPSQRVGRAGMGAKEAKEASDTALDPRIEHGFVAVAEDDGSFAGAPEPRRNLGVDVSVQTKLGRLQALLSKQVTEAAPVLSRQDLEMKRNLARPNHSDTDLDLMALRMGKERRSTHTPNRVPLAPKPNHTMPNMRVPNKKDEGQKKTSRLRLLPPEKLRLEDFKINPKFNNGYTHAFDDVVRDKAGRAELAGCVDMNCCGKQFLAMAQSELDHGGTAILARDADVVLMEEFLGEDAYRLMGMSPDEKKGIWLKAKMRNLANRYGRCRHRVARRPSPPGFWNPDFPNTQEVKENRQEAEKIEREMVAERYQEAKRGGGRWMFRDE